jgi:hypothetical protein
VLSTAVGGRKYTRYADCDGENPDPSTTAFTLTIREVIPSSNASIGSFNLTVWPVKAPPVTGTAETMARRSAPGVVEPSVDYS